MIPDPFNKTVRIPVRLTKGRLELLYGGSLLDKIDDATIGELVVPSFSVNNTELLEKLTAERTIELVPANTSLLVRVRQLDGLESNFNKYLQTVYFRTMKHQNNKYSLHQEGQFVELKAMESLKLQLRGTKRSILCDCKCRIPFLETEAESLNHAYSLISQSFEKRRRSHTGNVFNHVFYRGGKDTWYPLEHLRETREREAEASIFGCK